MINLRRILILAILVFSFQSYAQDVPVSFRNEAIYDFLDELANGRVITINSAIKPFTNSFILQCLNEAEKNREQLTIRQQKELGFYLRQYRFIGEKGKNLFWYV